MMDKHLLERNVISQEAYDTIADFVHDLMDKGTHEIPPELYEAEYPHHPEIIRYLYSKKDGQGKIPRYLLTDGLRIAFGHLVIYEFYREYPSMPIDELLKKAYYNFRYHEYEKQVSTCF